MDETTNVNNLNGIPNFGHGLPEDGVVQAGISDTDTPSAEVVVPEETVVPEPEEVAPSKGNEDAVVDATPEEVVPTENAAPVDE